MEVVILVLGLVLLSPIILISLYFLFGLLFMIVAALRPKNWSETATVDGATVTYNYSTGRPKKQD